MRTLDQRITALEERVAQLEGRGTPARYYEPELEPEPGPDRVEVAAEATD